VLTYHVDESVECRAATDEERAMVPPPVVWSEQEWAEYRETMRQGYRDLQTWLQDDCPGLTPEIEQALPPRTIDKVRQYMQSVDIDTFMPVEPRRHPPDTNKE
jgi:hypothetical protein